MASPKLQLVDVTEHWQDWKTGRAVKHAGRMLAPVGGSSTEQTASSNAARHTETVVRLIATKQLVETIAKLDDRIGQASQMFLDAADASEEAAGKRHAAMLKQSSRLALATWALVAATVVMAFATVLLAVKTAG